MINKVSLILVVKLVCLITVPIVNAAQTVEIYTYEGAPPYSYKNKSGKLTGINIEIVKMAISRMPDYAVIFKIVPWARAKAYAKSGKAFAILSPYFHAHDWLTDTEPKRPYIWPYSMPLYSQEDVVICNTAVLKQPRNDYPNDFAGLSFIMWNGDGRAGVQFDQMVKDKKVKLKRTVSTQTKVKELLYGRRDCTITAKLPFFWTMEKVIKTREHQLHKGKVKIEQVAVISISDSYLGYTDIDAEKNFPYKKDFTIKFDVEIFKMKRSGEIDNIIKKFIDQ